MTKLRLNKTRKTEQISTLKNSEFEAEPQEKNIKLIRNLKNNSINHTWLNSSQTKFKKFLKQINYEMANG
jgi:hypothetical protein